MSIFTRPAIWRLIASGMQRHVRECMEFKGFEREGGALFVFTMKRNSKHTRVEVTIKEKVLEHLNDVQVSDIILRRMCQKFEDQGINIPLNEQVAAEETPQKILKEVCTRLEDTNIIVQIDNNALDGIVFEFHDLGEDVYVNVSVSEEQIDSAPESVVAAMIVRRMRLSFAKSGARVQDLKEDDKPVVYKVDYVSDFTKPNIPGFGDWGQ